MASNPNTISSGIRETWDKTYQVTHHKIPVYPAFATFRLAKDLEVGDTVNRHYRNTMVAHDMAGDGGYQRQAITNTQEQLIINKEKEASFYVKKLDEIQNHLPVRKKHAFDAMAAIFNQIDGDVLGEYDSYSNSIDDSDLSGTSGNGISVTTSNVRRLFSIAKRKVQRENIMLDNVARFTGFRKEDAAAVRGVSIISPDVYQLLIESLDGKDSALGDTVGINGHVGRYYGFDLFVSNALGWSATLAFGSTKFSDGDIIVINGVSLTMKTSLGATAGNVLISSTVADNIDSIVACINDSENLSAVNGGAGPSTAGTDYVELSLANRNLLKNIVASDDDPNMTLKATGYGFIALSETATPSDILWTAAKEVQHCLFGVNNSVDLVIQKNPSLEIKDRDGKVGKDVVTWTAYGKKVFNEQTKKMIDVQVRTDTYS
jgi:hypothetical protein